jgi:glycine/D-amino acid oxidase-like deaminating enzyme
MKKVIVGAGFAGLSTAYHLARKGVGDLLVLEREEGPGMFASGRNAGLLRQSSSDEALLPLLRSGARAARRLLRRVPGAIQPSGSLIMGATIDRLRAGPRAKILDASERVAGLKGRALFDPDDAIVDPHALLGLFEGAARRRGVEIAYLEELKEIEVLRGQVKAVVTSKRTIPVEGVVVAAGAWAGKVAEMAGSRAVAIQARRRHLFRGSLEGRSTPEWPFVWHEESGVYFRPEGDGLLFSPCDVEPYPARDPELDPGQRDVLARKLYETFGDLGEFRLGPGWPCLRTFASDERFVIGRDPRLRGLFWVAGLGGHGVTAAWAIGRLAAGIYTGECDPGAFDPARFSD